ncbi:uncharacterized protein LOC132718965 [Ruditapes philippinarum]|uniref:uncharacterized protein LOC132718965 n=1 Tax=Ruditapes philippinarum TaxID=129788 RepID=UPI00295BECE1|nr:uncharacterized protein LOC132718965 [Ruditapes philippinarum]
MMETISAILVVILLFITNECDAAPGCSPDEPVFVWPLHLKTGSVDIVTNTSNGDIGSSCTFVSVVGENIASAIEFSGESDSYINLGVQPSATFLSGDYTIQFYLNVKSATSGVLMQYKSLSQTIEFDIEEWKIFLNDGIINVHINGMSGEQLTYDKETIVANTWYHIMLERDISREAVKIFLDRKELGDKGISKNFVDKPTLAPGMIYLGQDSNHQNNLRGMISCLQIIPCKETVKPWYDTYCDIGNVSYVNLIDTTTTTTTTTVQPTTTTTTNVPPTASNPKLNYLGVEDRCSHFTLMKQDATYNDVIMSTEVVDIVSCFRLCNQDIACFTFAVRQNTGSEAYHCKLGIRESSVHSDPGSMIYIRK